MLKSSKFIRQFFELNLKRMGFNAHCDVEDSFFRPNGIPLNYYVPVRHVNEVLCRSSGLIGICQ